jgi:hypothetical protein
MNFIDIHGRYHQKPITPERPYPGNNAFLFTGYAEMVGLKISYLEVLDAWVKSKTKYGYNRHPNGDKFPSSSHDELVGFYMTFNYVMPSLVNSQYENQYWQFCNLEGFKPTPWWKLNPIKVLIDFWRLYREEKPRTATNKYPYLWPIIFKHSAQHVYFYKRMAGVPTGIYLTIRFLLASAYTLEFGSLSSQVMLGFKLLALKGRGLSYFEQCVYDDFFKEVDFKQIVTEYFHPYENHPIITALQGKDL